MILAIKNASVVTECGIIENGTILVSDGIIEKVGVADEITIPKNAKIYDAKGGFAGPGFVDIHVHGGDGGFLFSEPERVSKFFLAHGETTVLPTFYYDLSKEEFLKYIKLVKDAMQNGKAPTVAGFYMEGPYMNPKYGASPEKNKWRGRISAEDYKDILKEAADTVLAWVIAPEREGIEEFVSDAKAENPNVKFFVGHSEATPDEIFRLKKYGITGLTHAMCATGRIPTLDGTRSCGPDEACFLDDDMYAELICDSLAIHVHPDMQKLILKIKGVDKVILISDSYVSTEPTPDELSHITDLSFDANGGLCGSKLTLDTALKNIVKHTGVSVSDAFRMASTNPAKAIGLFDKVGSIEIGKRANIVILNKKLDLEDVIFEGRIIERNI